MNRDLSQMNYKERIAATDRLCYIDLGGNIGVISNGSGGSLATNDALRLYGAAPACFVDMGGQAYHEKITATLSLLEKDEAVDAIFINMFCGQLNADKVSVVVRDAI